ncbi:hypothetical protein [Ancylobacter radicis]|uniref:Uncharacterized protein n=1 Tax=Ancylobacter radicis TaxID=2836179 RepID=A0ABS5R3H4_9HYPH|nr:hypothetical protein [Ancylobacter radicis]MBS9476209.1 hypothetical protein [Ancylobacter radicis]
MSPIETALLGEHAAQSAVLVMTLQLFAQACVPAEQRDDVLRKLEEAGYEAVRMLPIPGISATDLTVVREHAMIRVSDIISAVSQSIRNAGDAQA